MRALLLQSISDVTEHSSPLTAEDLPDPVPGRDEVLLKVLVCGVCHTELDEIEGRTPPPVFPVVPGHQVVGTVIAAGSDVTTCSPGDRLGVAWIFSACGTCRHCAAGNENLCSGFVATGRDVHGGYAEYMTVPAAFAHPIPAFFDDAEAAPLLCAGAIGYRSLRLTGLKNGDRLGMTGFGASAHLVMKMARHRYPDSEVFVFARSERERSFARELGAVWAGDTAERSPVGLDCIIDTTPAWKPVVEALANLTPGGRLVINAIRKEASDQAYLQRLNYATHLWEEKEIKSVANVARRDVSEFLDLAASMRMKPTVELYPLEDANRALSDLKKGSIRGAKVLRVA